MKQFDLYFGTILIGRVHETNWDMRSSGDISYSSDLTDAEASRLNDFVRHSIEAGIALESGDHLKYELLCKKEYQFIDLIESTEWLLVEESGVKRGILCPVFHEGDEVTWQYS